MRNFTKVTLLTLIVGAFARPAWAEDLMSSELADQARVWQQKNRDDLAGELWRKLLRADPKHGEALVKLGMIDARAGKLKQADAMLSRAKQLKPAPRGLAELTAAVQALKNPPKPAPVAAVKPEEPKAAAQPQPEVRQKAHPAAAQAALAPPKLRKAKKTDAALRVETALQAKPDTSANQSAAVVLALNKPEASPSPGPQENQAKALAVLKAAMADEMNSAYDAAAAKLEEAMVLDPVNPWVRLALARQYQRLGVRGGASNLLDNLIEANPGMPEALYARALLYASEQMWWEALGAMERIAPAARSADMARDQRRMWVNLQAQRARQLFAQGRGSQANAALESAQAAAGGDESLLAQVAGGWSDIGDAARGLRLMRELVSGSSLKDLPTRIKYAEILLNSGQDAELSAVLRDLSAPGRLSPAQQEQINAVILGYTLRLAETLREAGRYAEAAEVIGPAAQRSDDARLQAALARIYKASGDEASALALIEKVIVREPDDLGHRLLASELALALNVMDKADGHAKAALELAPDHPRALAAAGQVEKARGNLPQALQYFRHAYAMEQDRNAFAGVSGNLALRLLDDEPSPAALTVKPAAVERTGLLPVPDPAPRTERPPAAANSNFDPEPQKPQRLPIRPEQPGAASPLSDNKTRILARVADLLASSDGAYAINMTRINYVNGTSFPTVPAATPQVAAALEDSEAPQFDGLKLKLSVSLNLGRSAQRGGRSL